jgi:hypothetical protein
MAERVTRRLKRRGWRGAETRCIRQMSTLRGRSGCSREGTSRRLVSPPKRHWPCGRRQGRRPAGARPARTAVHRSGHDLPVRIFVGAMLPASSRTISGMLPLLAALIQGLRDYFGSHTHARVDRAGTFHADRAGGAQEHRVDQALEPSQPARDCRALRGGSPRWRGIATLQSGRRTRRSPPSQANARAGVRHPRHRGNRLRYERSQPRPGRVRRRKWPGGGGVNYDHRSWPDRG